METVNTESIASGSNDHPSPYSDNSENKSLMDTQETLSNPTLKSYNGFTSVLPGFNKNTTELPEFLVTLLDANSICGDSRCAFVKPDWFDMDMFQRGQQFGVNYSFGVMYADLLSLFILFAFHGGLGPLIFTGKSDTPFKAFKRYLSTAVRVNSWYETDVWDPQSVGHKNLKIVRGKHERTRDQMTKMAEDEVEKRITLIDDEGSKKIWTTYYEDIKEDFQASCPHLRGSLRGSNPVHISQTDMVVTQFGFIGLILLYPKMFGVHSANKRDFESFAHFWRTIGYLLGIEDRFNLCTGELETVQQRCQDLVEFWVKPSFRMVTHDWIHMSRCLSEGISYYVAGITFEVLLVYLCTVLNIATPRLKAALSWTQQFLYYYTYFLFMYLFRISRMLTFHNRLINLAIKKAQAKSPETLVMLEQKLYTYQENRTADVIL